MSGKEHALHSFKGSLDGENPWGGLATLKGTLYGTTSGGGAGCSSSGGCGIVFKVGKTGESALYSFKGPAQNDGADPQYNNDLMAFNGLLFGMTDDGGSSKLNWGTVFEINGSGSERVLYSFGSKAKDGVYPAWGLIALDGMLYGTTTNGGTHNGGTVFEVSTSGKERVLYSFKGGADGAGPVGSLVALNGVLYGTTEGGGTGCVYLDGCGTIFAVSISGKERVLYRFSGAPDGVQPEAGLTKVAGRKDMLYGTTEEGGTACTGSGSFSGCGTVFEVSTSSGVERILHSFHGYVDGAYPFSALTVFDGTLFGTTSGGGSGGCASNSGAGCGTVFRISPSSL